MKAPRKRHWDIQSKKKSIYSIGIFTFSDFFLYEKKKKKEKKKQFKALAPKYRAAACTFLHSLRGASLNQSVPYL